MHDNMVGLVAVIKALGLDEACVKLLENDIISRMAKLHQVDDVYEHIAVVGSKLNVSEKAGRLVEELAERTNIIVHKLKYIPDSQRPSVKIVVEDDLTHGAEAYVNTVIKTAGGRVYAETGLADDGPELFIFLARNKSMFQLLGEVPALLAEEEWENTPAIKQNKVFLVDGEKHLRGALPEIADDVELLAELLYPQYFVFGQEGESWMKFELE